MTEARKPKGRGAAPNAGPRRSAWTCAQRGPRGGHKKHAEGAQGCQMGAGVRAGAGGLFDDAPAP